MMTHTTLSLHPGTTSASALLALQEEDLDLWRHMVDALHQSVYRVAGLLTSILPGLLAFVLALCLLTGVGVLLSLVARRILTALRFDERIAHKPANAIADWSPAHSPTQLVGRVLFWGSVLLGLVIGVSALDASSSNATGLGSSLLPYLTRSIGAVLLLFVGSLVARFLSRTVLIGAVNNQLQYARFLSMGVKWLVLVLTGAMVLDYLQIGGTIVELAFGILFGGIVLTLALAIGLGSRDLVTRSLERGNTPTIVERTPKEKTAAEASGSLRHF